MRYSEELQSILDRFGAGPAPKDQVVQYLGRSSQAAEQQAGEILDDLESEGYVEVFSDGEGDFVRFTDKAINEVFD